MLGGALGALLRYGVSQWCRGITWMNMPLATLAVNLVGCFLLGWFTSLGAHHTGIPRPILLMLTTGMCGAFTTFSTFSGENVGLVENGHPLSALLYITVSIVLGFILFWLGKSL